MTKDDLRYLVRELLEDEEARMMIAQIGGLSAAGEEAMMDHMDALDELEEE